MVRRTCEVVGARAQRWALLGLAAVVALSLAPLPALGADVECDPAPIGRCGDYQLEQQVYCWIPAPGVPYTLNSPTDREAVAVGTNGATIPGVARLNLAQYVPNAKDLVYVRLRPVLDFLANPASAPAPSKVVWQEQNGANGLQMVASTCGLFTWREDCVPQQWMGPSGSAVFPPDKRLA